MALVKKYKAEVVSIIKHTEDLYTVAFVSKGNRFKYHPGQFLHIALDSEYDGCGQWPESRCFSMQTSPASTSLKITYSVKGRFTKMMANDIKVGSQVWLKLPYGDLFLEEHNKKNTVFIAGGTGITPFLSLFTDPCFAEYVSPRLYFGFREPKLDIYNTELSQAKLINESLDLVKVDQSMDGILNIGNIYDSNLTAGAFFISGPQLMISEFKNVMTGKGVPLENIITDEWE